MRTKTQKTDFWHPLFLAGKHRELCDLFYLKKNLKRDYLASYAGAMVYLGQVDLLVHEFIEPKFSKHPQVQGLFYFLVVGLTRRSEYEKAKEFVAVLKKNAGELQYFAEMADGFYSYYVGSDPLRAAKNACLAADKSEDYYMRCIAYDLYGHSLVRNGQIDQGIQNLYHAAALARGSKNKINAVEAFEISICLYKAEFGLIVDAVHEIRDTIAGLALSDDYSKANLMLELGRQYTLRGNFDLAQEVLRTAAPLIYAFKNRRQEIALNLRLAELSFQMNDFFTATNCCHFARRIAHSEPDASYVLQAIGIELKIARVKQNQVTIKNLEKEWSAFENSHKFIRDTNLRSRLKKIKIDGNAQDRIFALLMQNKLSPLIQNQFLTLAAEYLQALPGRQVLYYIQEIGVYLLRSQKHILCISKKLSDQQLKILNLILGSTKPVSKEDLVQRVWGYNYSPLRHDKMIYAAIGLLRKVFLPEENLIRLSEAGYNSDFELIFHRARLSIRKPTPSIEPTRSKLNYRQLQIIELLETQRFISVSDCKRQFHCSEITALRDLNYLVGHGYLVRTGKARATRYSRS